MRTEDDLRAALHSGLSDPVDVAAGRAGVERRVRRHRWERVGLVAALVALVVAVVPVLVRDDGQEVEMQPVERPPTDMARSCLSGPLREILAEGDSADGHWVIGAHQAGFFTVHMAPTAAGPCGTEVRSAPSLLNGNQLALDEGQDHPYEDGPIVLGSVSKNVDRVRVTLRTGVTRDVAPIGTPDRFEANVFVLFPRNASERVGVAKAEAYDGRRRASERHIDYALQCGKDERGVIRDEVVSASTPQAALEAVVRSWYRHTEPDPVQMPTLDGAGEVSFDVLRDGESIGKHTLKFDGKSTWTVQAILRCVPQSAP